MKLLGNISLLLLLIWMPTVSIQAQTLADSTKLATGNHNPILDFLFTADPTAVEHEGRLYVYGTNDHEQFDSVGVNGKNSYEKIKSLAMMSTDDMVNWTYHGLIPTGELAPWIINSWAPSACKRVEEDGKTHFYLYFSNSGYGVGVLTATSPVGPWRSPLQKSLVDAKTPGLGDCKVPFDPGVVVVSQIKPLNPYQRVEAETVCATNNALFVPSADAGNMVAMVGSKQVTIISKDMAVLKVSRVDFGKCSRHMEMMLRGKGSVEVRISRQQSYS